MKKSHFLASWEVTADVGLDEDNPSLRCTDPGLRDGKNPLTSFPLYLLSWCKFPLRLLLLLLVDFPLIFLSNTVIPLGSRCHLHGSHDFSVASIYHKPRSHRRI
ncbi:Adp-Ribose Glycohydrolase Macrod2 [Manis pentadactyla]|nr:Adp-Ribose Glycohydrolase Macrod2 [Manis pentadactyla]